MKVTVWTYEVKRALGAYSCRCCSAWATRARCASSRLPVALTRTLGQRRNPAQIGTSDWLADIAAPSNFARPFTCEGAGTPSPHYCDPAIDAQFAAARRATGTDSNALWQKVYERIEAAAPAVPLGQPPRGHARLEARRPLHDQPAVGPAPRPALGAVSARLTRARPTR